MLPAIALIAALTIERVTTSARVLELLEYRGLVAEPHASQRMGDCVERFAAVRHGRGDHAQLRALEDTLVACERELAGG